MEWVNSPWPEKGYFLRLALVVFYGRLTLNQKSASAQFWMSQQLMNSYSEKFLTTI